MFEGWITLGAWAPITKRARLGLLVGANTFRNPGLVAKQATTLDHISGGRAILGIGGAWFDLEHEAHGIDFGTGFGQRLDWLDQSVSAIRTLLDGGTVDSEGWALSVPSTYAPATAGPGAAPDHDRRLRRAESGSASRPLRGGRPRSGRDRDDRRLQAANPRHGSGCAAALAESDGAQQDAHGERG
ncbi:MAG: LLM class flavin-dependent oxidoreductase [Chloroflexi bacterium]|nr:LLM class flavin-dependent oxidoreductase [Chloroflexota bacterium]